MNALQKIIVVLGLLASVFLFGVMVYVVADLLHRNADARVIAGLILSALLMSYVFHSKRGG